MPASSASIVHQPLNVIPGNQPAHVSTRMRRPGTKTVAPVSGVATGNPLSRSEILVGNRIQNINKLATANLTSAAAIAISCRGGGGESENSGENDRDLHG
ncbi:hypothetical protein I7I48_02094 [Histoplasma ohiense]|nr:hypothetical protein I7I48_02094 [Histoplasma ohiense (nom. inval.)]